MELQRPHHVRQGLQHDRHLLSERDGGLARAAVLASLLVLLAGCQRSETSSVVSVGLPDPPAAAHELTLGDLVSVTDAYWQVEEWRETAQNALVTSCVRAAGISGFVTSKTVPDLRMRSEGDGRYAQRSGFGVWDSEHAKPPQTSPEMDRALLGPEDARQVKVTLPGDYIIGVPTRGCFAKARHELGGDVAAWTRVEYLPNELHTYALHQVADDPALQSARKRWTQCMRVFAYTASSPHDLQGAYEQAYPDLPKGVPPAKDFRSSEIHAAVVSLACQRSSGYQTTLGNLLQAEVGHLNPDQRAQGAQVIASLRSAAQRVPNEDASP